jgi:tRNA (guanine-N7-)-methyltransferase
MRLKFLPSFVKRRGRITKRQEESLTFLNKFSVFNIKDIQKESLEYDHCCLEIGFGNAEHLIYQSDTNPKTLFIGSEVYMSGIGSLLSYINKHEVTNIRIFSDDIRILLDQDQIEIFDSVNIICPDPWPKERHHKRRLINGKFINMIQGFIKNNGYLFISTDWDNYAESIKEVLDRSVFFMSSNNASLEKNSLTKFEQRGVDEGRDIHEFNYRKNN